MSSLIVTPKWSLPISRAPRATLTIRMDTGTSDGVPEDELEAIQATVRRGVLRIARALNDRQGGGRSPGFLKDLSALEPAAIDATRAEIIFEAPHDTEQFPIEFPEGDAGVQAIELFVHALGTLIEGGDPAEDIGEPAARSVGRFTRTVADHDRAQVVAVVGETVTAIEFDPGSVPRRERRAARSTLSFVGRMYGVNLSTRRFRFRDELGRSRLLSVGDGVDAKAMARDLLGDIVSVSAQRGTDGATDQFVAVSVVRADAQEMAAFEQWEAGAADAAHGHSPAEELQIPGLGMNGET